MPFFSPESSHHHRYEVPLPVSLTLYNLHVPLSNIATTHESSSSKTTLFRPEYTSDLLFPVRLDVIFSGNNNNNNNIQEEQDTDIVLYSSQNDNHPSIHPCWNHLEERIEALQQDDSIYTHLKCMLLLVSLQHSEPPVLVATVPLHPSKLRRLPPPSDHQQQQQQQQEAWQQQQPPPPTRLPPNAILIHFSDGATRVCPPLYHLLLQQDVIREVNLQDSSLLQDDVEEYKQASRFDDDVFLTLDDDFHQTKTTTSSSSTVKQQRTTSPLSLLETDDESQAVPVQVTSLHSGSDDIDGSDEGLENDERMRNAEKMAKLSLMDETTKLPSQVDIRIIDLQRKKQELELLIAQEEACLQEELAELRENEECLKALMERVSKVESETILIQTDANETRIKKGELHFCLEAQRIKLLDELRMIYPIRCQAEETWFIRGQEIPHDLFSGGVSEEEISAALGFLCHSVVMISKYLAIALRYRIVCNSSRSAIQQDATTILPLFQARMVERDELQRAMALIERNVACILKTRGIDYLEDSHILCKVNRIYAQIVDGQR